MAKKNTRQNTAKTAKTQAKQRIARTEAYADEVRREYADAVNDILKLKTSVPKLDTGVMYSFAGDTKKIQKQVENVLRRLYSTTMATIQSGMVAEWNKANDEIDQLITSAVGKRAMNNPELAAWFDRNTRAMNAFVNRTQNGFNLSSRIWQNTQQLRDEMEVAITVSIGEGQSAAEMSRKVRKYLNDPDLMFRRFRYKDDDGKWQLKWKKRIQTDDGRYRWIDYDRNSYRTGQGVYKSSYRNAMRVTRTETNMAYRNADHERWMQEDFVLGQRIETSDSHPKDDICDELAGDYPKDFVFEGWHPQCFCICTPILRSEEDMRAERQALLRGEDYVSKEKPITTYPDGFTRWVETNKADIMDAMERGTAPYFVAHNVNIINNIIDGKLPEEPEKITPQDIADVRHAARTPEQIQDIRDRWAEHQKVNQEIKDNANDTLKLAKEYMDVDATTLQKYVDDGDLTRMRRETETINKMIEDVKKQEEKLSALIPDVHKWHQQFTMQELESVYKSVEDKLDKWQGLSLEDQAKKLNFEAKDYLGGNMNDVQSKYKTWQVSQAAYLSKLDEVNYKIDIQKVETQLDTIEKWSSQHPKSIKVATFLADAKAALAKGGDIAEIQQKADLAETEYNKRIAEQARRDAKRLSVTETSTFGADAYSQARKDKAIWDKQGGKKANAVLFETASKAWQGATEKQKDCIYEYTYSYCKTNEPLENRTYVGSQTRANFEERVNNITAYISKNTLPQDMWFQRGDSDMSVIASRLRFNGQTVPKGITSGNNLSSLIGLEMQEGGFLSMGSAKGKGFDYRPVILNIYAPKGVQAAYAEPFSDYGNGGKRNWTGREKYKSFSSEFETILQRGTKLRITNAYYSYGKYYIDCEVTAQEIRDLSYVTDSQIGY